MAIKKSTGMSRQEAGRKGAEARWGTKSTSTSNASRSSSKSSNSPYSSSRAKNASRRSEYLDYEPEYRQSSNRRTSSNRQPASREHEYYAGIGRQRSRSNEEYDSPYFRQSNHPAHRSDRRFEESYHPEFYRGINEGRDVSRGLNRGSSSRNAPQFRGIGNRGNQRFEEIEDYGFSDEEDELEFIRGQRGRHPHSGRAGSQIWGAFGIDEDDDEEEEEDEDEDEQGYRGHHPHHRKELGKTSGSRARWHEHEHEDEDRYAHSGSGRSSRQEAGRKGGLASRSNLSREDYSTLGRKGSQARRNSR